MPARGEEIGMRLMHGCWEAVWEAVGRMLGCYSEAAGRQGGYWDGCWESIVTEAGDVGSTTPPLLCFRSIWRCVLAGGHNQRSWKYEP